MLRADHPRLARAVALERVGSTNTELRRLALEHDWPHASAVVTGDQTAGRGRLDRTWTSAAGDGLAISVLLRPHVPADALAWLPLVAGVAMVDAVAPELGDRRAMLKWPNDVLVADAAHPDPGGHGRRRERKVAGVLAELVAAHPPAVVVGVGVNVRTPAERLPVPTASSLVLAGAPDDDGLAQRVYDRYIEAVVQSADALEAASGDAEAAGIAAAVRTRTSTVGRRVRVDLPGGRRLVGVATGIDAYGALIVDTDDGTDDGDGVRVTAGDVTHVRYE